MVLGVRAAAYHQGIYFLVRLKLEFHVYFHLFTKEKNIISVRRRIMVKSYGVLPLQYIEVNGDLVLRTVNLSLLYVNVTHQGREPRAIIDFPVTMVLNVIVQQSKNATQKGTFLTVIGNRVVANP